jgi:CheY-like chemotaxis protein
MSKPLAFIVEDDQYLNQIFKVALQEDFTTESFDDGARALDRLAEMAPRVVILDLNLPSANGEEILSFIRSSEFLQDVKVILCTADDRQAEYLRESADLVLLKPISPRLLRQLTARLK